MGIDALKGDQNKRAPDDKAPGGVVVGHDGRQIVLSAQEMQEIKEAKEQADKERQQVIVELVSRLIEKREQVIRARRDIDKRWVDDQRQWDGESRLLNTKEFPSQTNDDNMKPPRPHLTRARCDLWESRAIDLIVPTNEPTWDLNPLTQEDLQAPPGMDPGQWTASLQAIKDDAEKRALGMKQVIQDQLAACNASKALRNMIKDAMRMGTGLVMGPMNGTHVRRKYNPNSANDPDPKKRVKVVIEESIIPEIREGDPRCFFPDMTSSAEKAEYAFYVHWMSETDLWNFAEFPGVDKDEVMAIMEEKPQYGEVEASMKEWNQHSGLREDITNRHAVWRYTGIIDRKYCKALDLECDEGMVCADIWFCNQHILKSKLTMLSAVKDFRIPYYVFSPFPIDDTMFGASIAYLCRDSQRMADSTLLGYLHNMSCSAGPQTVIWQGKLKPADGKYSIRGPKVWYKLDETPMADVFQSSIIPNNGEAILEGFQVAKQLMDEELNTTQWASPDTSEPAQSGIGWAMMTNARTILQRRVCASADDEVLGPVITRMVLWNLLYSDREDIKGDYDVQPLCQSVRLVKDIQNQQKLFIANNVAQSPMFQSCFLPHDMVSDIIRGLDVPVENWLKPKDQWLQEQQQQAQQAQQSPQMALLAAKTHESQMKATTETMKQAKMAHEASQPTPETPPQMLADPHDTMELQKHAMDKQVELAGFNSDLAAAHENAQARTTAAAFALQGKREDIAGRLHQAGTHAETELMKTATHAHVEITKANAKFTPGPNAPKPASIPFKAPKVPSIKHR